MNEIRFEIVALVVIIASIFCSGDVNAQYEINWYTIDGGGGCSGNGTFELEGTIGQHDAGQAMTGGGYSISGGFWTRRVILGDINGDGVVDLLDVSPFIDILSSGTYVPEADVNEDGAVDLLDIAPFVDLLAN